MPIWAASKVTNRIGAGMRSAAAKWMASLRRTGWVRDRGRAVEAALVDGHDVEVVPRQPDRVLEIEAKDRLVGHAVDRREGLGQRHGRRGPHRVVGQCGERDRSHRSVDRQRQQRTGVERHRHRPPPP
jgi:hypothetical protein